MVGFGQKSGVDWRLVPTTAMCCGTRSWPAGTGTLDGIEWGTATDGTRIYTEIADSGHASYTLVPSGTQISWGSSWSALDAQTGRILWQTADPTPGSIDFGAVSVANGVVYAGSQSDGQYVCHGCRNRKDSVELRKRRISD
jgi:polyvinyl alcohol dehydrogenase (cytochrome)